MRGKGIVGMVVTLTLLGCARGPSAPSFAQLNDEQLFQEGLRLMEKKRWEDARSRFRFLVRAYVQSPYREKAYLYIADTYFHQGLGADQMAINAYQDFLRLYPNSPDAPYALFQIGMTYFRKAQKPQRDQTETRKALEAFQQVIERFPVSEWAQKAKEYAREAQRRLIEHEAIIGKFYYSRNNYTAAYQRFAYIFDHFPPETVPPEIYLLMHEVLKKMGRFEESLEYLKRLQTLYPGTRWAARAAALLKETQRSSS